MAIAKLHDLDGALPARRGTRGYGNCCDRHGLRTRGATFDDGAPAPSKGKSVARNHALRAPSMREPHLRVSGHEASEGLTRDATDVSSEPNGGRDESVIDGPAPAEPPVTSTAGNVRHGRRPEGIRHLMVPRASISTPTRGPGARFGKPAAATTASRLRMRAYRRCGNSAHDVAVFSNE